MIPNIIHFVWAGNNDTMPKYSLETVAKWAKQNPGHDVWVWIDSKTTSSDASQKGYQELLSAHKNISLKDINELKDIDSNGKGWEIIRYEIEKILPNYGASSDLLRYLILYTHGGLYLDSDNPPGKLSFARVCEALVPDTNLFVYPYSQGATGIGNDVLICQERNPLIKKIYEAALANYSPEQMKIFIGSSGSIGSLLKEPKKKNFTIKYTGPENVRNILKTTSSMEEVRDFGEEPLERVDYYDTLPKNFIDTSIENQTEWLKTTTKPNANIDANDLIKKIKSSIEFEVKNLGVFDPEHYVQQAMIVLYLNAPEKKKTFSLKLLKELATQKFTQINYIPFVQLEDYFFDYYAQHFPSIMLDTAHIQQAYRSFHLTAGSMQTSSQYIEFILENIALKNNIQIKALIDMWKKELGNYCQQHSKPSIDIFADDSPEESDELDSKIIQFSNIFEKKVQLPIKETTVIKAEMQEIAVKKAQKMQ
jgi:hypothetical protein